MNKVCVSAWFFFLFSFNHLSTLLESFKDSILGAQSPNKPMGSTALDPAVFDRQEETQ